MDVLKRGACGKGVPANGVYTGRDRYAFEGRTTGKSKFSNLCQCIGERDIRKRLTEVERAAKSGDAVGNGDGSQFTATLENVISQCCDAVGDRDGFHSAIRECLCADLPQADGKSDVDQVSTGKSPLVDFDEIFGEVDLPKIVCLIESLHADLRNGVGQLRGVQTGAAGKSKRSNACDAGFDNDALQFFSHPWSTFFVFIVVHISRAGDGQGSLIIHCPGQVVAARAGGVGGHHCGRDHEEHHDQGQKETVEALFCAHFSTSFLCMLLVRGYRLPLFTAYHCFCISA